jgi:hypothetical protein
MNITATRQSLLADAIASHPHLAEPLTQIRWGMNLFEAAFPHNLTISDRRALMEFRNTMRDLT